jgi:hypothetical protein
MFRSNLNVSEIRRRIRKFRIRAEGTIPDAEVYRELELIFGGAFGFPAEYRSYPKETKFFRARSIQDSETEIPFRVMKNISDAWEPPPEYVTKPGRLNSVGQGILYCCPSDPELAIDEARARGRKWVAVIVYRAVREISVAVLGDYLNSGLPKDRLTHLFYSFLDEEFGRVVPEGQEGRYAITRVIADTFFNYPNQDAWCYRSVISPKRFNTAFLQGRSRQCLVLVGVMICDLTASNRGALNVKFVVDFDTATGEARYHTIGSEGQKRLFPEIR